MFNKFSIFTIYQFKFKTNNQKIDNYVYLERGPDQFDYQTIAINYANNYEFLTTGELNKNIDYKIIDDKTQLDNKKVY